MPGMRTSEIIIANCSLRRTSSARSPEATGTVSKPWLVRNELSRLRCPASSSTIRMRGAALAGTGDMASTLPGNLQMRGTKDRAAWFVGQAFDFPAVRQCDLLDDCQAKAGSLLV